MLIALNPNNILHNWRLVSPLQSVNTEFFYIQDIDTMQVTTYSYDDLFALIKSHAIEVSNVVYYADDDSLKIHYSFKNSLFPLKYNNKYVRHDGGHSHTLGVADRIWTLRYKATASSHNKLYLNEIPICCVPPEHIGNKIVTIALIGSYIIAHYTIFQEQGVIKCVITFVFDKQGNFVDCFPLKGYEDKFDSLGVLPADGGTFRAKYKTVFKEVY